MSAPTRTLVPRALGALLLLALIATGCAAGAGAQNPNVAAVVNGDEISVTQLQEQVEKAARDPRVAQQIEASAETRRSLETRVLSGMVEMILIDQMAHEVGVMVTDQEVRDRLNELIETELGGRLAYEQLLKSQGLAEEDVLIQIRSTVLAERIQQKVGEELAPSGVSGKDVDDAYAQRFDGGEPVARHILLTTQEEAQQVKDRITAGEDFAALAKRLSTDPSSGPLGGLVGEVPPGQTVPEFENAVTAAKDGEVVGPVKTQFGFHIIERLPSPPPRDVVDDGLRQQLVQERRSEAFVDLLSKQREQAKVEVNPRFGAWDPKTGQVRQADPLGELKSEQLSGQQDGNQ